MENRIDKVNNVKEIFSHSDRSLGKFFCAQRPLLESSLIRHWQKSCGVMRLITQGSELSTVLQFES